MNPSRLTIPNTKLKPGCQARTTQEVTASSKITTGVCNNTPEHHIKPKP